MGRQQAANELSEHRRRTKAGYVSVKVNGRWIREHRAVMATALLFSGEATVVEASVGWLLDPAPSVRQALASALQDAARKGNVTPTMLRRMIAMRNWLPGDSRARHLTRSRQRY